MTPDTLLPPAAQEQAQGGDANDVQQDKEADAEGEEAEDEDDEDEKPIAPRTTRSGRKMTSYREDPVDGSDSDFEAPKPKRRSNLSRSLGDVS